MRLLPAINEYIRHKQALGMLFETEARCLASFYRALGPNVSLTRITTGQIKAFLDGSGHPTAFWKRKYGVLVGFNRFLVGHGHIDGLPLPQQQPRYSQTFVPYILKRGELRRLLAAVPHYCEHRLLQSMTLRTILLLLYGAALRISEATSLTVNDVDLAARLITVRQSKFYKTRLVPLGPKLHEVMKRYFHWCDRQGRSRIATTPFFVLRSGAPVTPRQVRDAFVHLRDHAQVFHPDGQRPRIHDIRHSSAVHRLLAWYRQGADVQVLLPALSVFLGHRKLVSTQVYLTTTPELLQEASRRFERYAGMEVNHA
jgi:site-specific recombinase XerD